MDVIGIVGVGISLLSVLSVEVDEMSSAFSTETNTKIKPNLDHMK